MFVIFVAFFRGNLPVALQGSWGQLQCDSLLSKADRYEREKWRLQSLNRAHPIHSPSPPVSKNPVIAVCVCSTTRTVWGLKRLDDLTLFSTLLPSFVKTAEPGFEYFFYITYDMGKENLYIYMNIIQLFTRNP